MTLRLGNRLPPVVVDERVHLELHPVVHYVQPALRHVLVEPADHDRASRYVRVESDLLHEPSTHLVVLGSLEHVCVVTPNQVLKDRQPVRVALNNAQGVKAPGLLVHPLRELVRSHALVERGADLGRLLVRYVHHAERREVPARTARCHVDSHRIHAPRLGVSVRPVSLVALDMREYDVEELLAGRDERLFSRGRILLEKSVPVAHALDLIGLVEPVGLPIR